MKYKSKSIIYTLIIFLFVIISCKDRPCTNPFDSGCELDPSEWAPINLHAEALSDSEIKLTWEQDNEHILGFKVERKTGDSIFEQIAEIPIELDNIKPEDKQFTDTNLILGTNYSYKVFAYTHVNESSFATENILLYNDCNGDLMGEAYENECGCVEGDIGLAEDFCYGCTDSDYPNYDSQATIDDGGCSNLTVQMVTLSGGTFEMGDIWGAGDSSEQPTHQVTLSSYKMSATEITNQQYANYLTEALSVGTISATSSSVTGSWEGNNYEFLDLDDSDCQISYSNNQFIVDANKENYPVIEVSWYGATGFAEYYGCRLPTEAEWEYAARGIASGEDHKWSGTSTESELTDYAWYSANYTGTTQEVATKLPNGNGLYDMSGNVYEWCNDYWYGSYESGSETDPEGPSSGSKRIGRGGLYLLDSYNLRCSYRGYAYPLYTSFHVGFRISRSNN
jgi:formylglycine-generating enzyme required for sulfatase activity